MASRMDNGLTSVLHMVRMCIVMRFPALNSVMAWLCLISFGMDIVVHASMVPVDRPSSSGDHGGWVHEDGEQDAYLSAGIESDETEHFVEHKHHPVENQPTDHDHDEGHHLSVQFRLSGQVGAIRHVIIAATLPDFLYDSGVQICQQMVFDRFVFHDTVERMRTVIMVL